MANRFGAVQRDTNRLKKILETRYTQTGDPRSSVFYQQGLGRLADLLRNIADTDRSVAASRGLAGGEMEIAQAGARRQQAVTGLNQLAGQAEAFDLQRSGQLLQGLLGLNQQGINVTVAREQSAQARSNRIAALVGAAFSAGGGIFAS